MYVYTCNYIVLSFDSANWNQLKLKKSLIRMVKSQWTPLFPVFFPHLRRGLLDFSRAVLLLRLRILLLHFLLSSSQSRSQWAQPDLHRER